MATPRQANFRMDEVTPDLWERGGDNVTINGNFIPSVKQVRQQREDEEAKTKEASEERLAVNAEIREARKLRDDLATNP